VFNFTLLQQLFLNSKLMQNRLFAANIYQVESWI